MMYTPYELRSSGTALFIGDSDILGEDCAAKVAQPGRKQEWGGKIKKAPLGRALSG
jgi:hypothetical protein